MPLSQRRRPPPLVFVPRQAPPPAEGEKGEEEEEEGEEEEGPDSPDSVGTTPGPDSPDFPGEEDSEEEEEEEEDEEEEGEENPFDTPDEATQGNPSAPDNSGDNRTVTPPTTTTSLPSSSSTSTSGPLGLGVGAGPDNTKKITPKEDPGGMGIGAQAALITFAVLGGLALIIGAYFFMRRRRRVREANLSPEPGIGFNEKPSSPTRALTFLPPVHHPHNTRSTENSNTLFGAGTYERPETVSTDNARSRIPPTPNPFADPPLNKAYDMLRGRVRSTTLTNRDSWEQNPFKDPISERFDPFGELQERARRERERYAEEMRRA
ncbi:hypothetical protein M011DRAFT_481970 [Sporormia fimetaria CBS 119925]|uniref:Uncharacterized protein n=1 Tax=Sporormia fimetaria CBS 119925 TaxID=1340428 RepID=A0A6A6UXG5_9PLEO|nr:hypothetical protein M011DRAFT_481970 [Sporormia fimetaria CBS 119925]